MGVEAAVSVAVGQILSHPWGVTALQSCYIITSHLASAMSQLRALCMFPATFILSGELRSRTTGPEGAVCRGCAKVVVLAFIPDRLVGFAIRLGAAHLVSMLVVCIMLALYTSMFATTFVVPRTHTNPGVSAVARLGGGLGSRTLVASMSTPRSWEGDFGDSLVVGWWFWRLSVIWCFKVHKRFLIDSFSVP